MMKTETVWPMIRRGMALLVLGILAAGISGCEADDDSEDTGGGVIGIWRRTDVVNGSTVLQETVELVAGGTINLVSADFVNQECFSVEGTWTMSGDSITTVVMGEQYTSTVVISGGNMVVTESNGTPVTYSRVSAMPTCDDYGFGGNDNWDGTFLATVGGTVIDFSSNLYVETDQNMMGVGGFNGTKNMAFVIDGTTAGAYTEANAAGTYMPNISVTTDAYISQTLTLNLTTVEANHIAGTFTFEAINPFTMASLSVTNGQINISHP